jgi:hypothetical protein
MSKPGPKVDPEKVAQVLLDAHALGDEAAARQHNVSVRTIANYRARMAADPIVAELFRSKKAALAQTWLDQTENARSRLLTRVLTLAEASTELRDVAGALKIVTDANVAERVVTDGLGEPGAGVPGQAGPSASLAGAATRLGENLH